MGDRTAKKGGRHLAARQVVEACRVALEAVPEIQGIVLQGVNLPVSVNIFKFS